MKRTFVFLLSCVALAAASQSAPPDAAKVRSVYLLPMGYGLEQFLANHLSESGHFQVVTDPKLADTIMTDRIGPSFESRMKDLFPPEPAPAPPQEEKTEKDKDAAKDEEQQPAGPPQALVKAPPPGGMSSFGRGKGNVFLVDAGSRQVIWSTFEKREGSSAEELERAATRIVARLEKSMKVSEKSAKRSRTAPPEPAPAPQPSK